MYYSKKFDTYIFKSLDDINTALSNEVSTINIYIYEKIRKSIDTGLDSLILFYVKVDDVLYNVKVNKNNVLPPLKKCLVRFEEMEDYQKCAECRDLMKRIEDLLL